MAAVTADEMELDQRETGSSAGESESEARSSDAQSDAEASDEEMPEKDDTEDELERLVFGDTAGFKDALRAREKAEDDQLAHDEAGDELAAAGDSDVSILVAIATREMR